MNKYEILYIIPGIFTDPETEAVATKIAGMITATGANIVRSQNLGKLKLAYPIKGQKHGVYMLVQFDADPSVVSKLEADLRLAENVVRHLVTERPEGAEKRTYVVEAYQAPLSEEGFRTRPTNATGAERKRTPGSKPTAPVGAAVPMARGPEMSVEELDKKLDAILEGTNENV